MSALPPKADIAELEEHVRFMPKADIRGGATTRLIRRRRIIGWSGGGKRFRHNYASVRCKSLFGFLWLAGLLLISPLSANAMKHPARSDFHTVVTAAGVSVTFKPTDSTYSFYRFAETGALSLAGIQHAWRNTDDYPSDEVQDMAQQIASGHASVHFGPFQDEEEVNRVHWRNFATQAKRDSAVLDSAHKGASDLRMLAQVEKWMAIIREINREHRDRHRVDYAI